MRITRKALKQSGRGSRAAVRRDMNGAIAQGDGPGGFLGSGSSGEPLGVIAGASTYGITETAIDAAPTYGRVPRGGGRFMTANAAGPGVRCAADPAGGLVGRDGRHLFDTGTA